MNYYFYRNISNDLIPSLVLSFYITILISLLVVKIIGRWKVFEKADIPGWHSLIPLLNQYDIFEMGGIDGIYVLFEFIPFLGPIVYTVFHIMALLEISKRFGKDNIYAVLFFFFAPIMFIIFGFNEEQFNTSLVGVEPIKKENTQVNNNITPSVNTANLNNGIEPSTVAPQSAQTSANPAPTQQDMGDMGVNIIPETSINNFYNVPTNTVAPQNAPVSNNAPIETPNPAPVNNIVESSIKPVNETPASSVSIAPNTENNINQVNSTNNINQNGNM